jgi:hypothetical protein
MIYIKYFYINQTSRSVLVPSMSFYIVEETALNRETRVFSLRSDTSVTREQFDNKVKEIVANVDQITLHGYTGRFSDGRSCQMFIVPADVDLRREKDTVDISPFYIQHESSIFNKYICFSLRTRPKERVSKERFVEESKSLLEKFRDANIRFHSSDGENPVQLENGSFCELFIIPQDPLSAKVPSFDVSRLDMYSKAK